MTPNGVVETAGALRSAGRFRFFASAQGVCRIDWSKGVRVRADGILFQAAVAMAVVLSFVAHELAHWAVGVGLRYQMEMSLNRAAPFPGQAVSAAHAMLISAAGPLLTLMQALVGTALAARGLMFAYPFVFAAFLTRLTASVVSVVNPNDEMRVSEALGIGPWTLPVLVTLALLGLTVYAARKPGIGWRVNAVAYIVSSAAVTMMVFGDRLLGA